MKKSLIFSGILIIVTVGIVMLYQSNKLTPIVIDEPVKNEIVLVEKYVRDNIETIATDKAVLGGTWYVVSVNINQENNIGNVVYEDGHIQSAGVFDYNFDSTTGAVVIEYFKVVKPSTITISPPIDDGIACTMDAMRCPDGSYVGRTGPRCEFVCPITTSLKGTIVGRVTLSPICPVERFPPEPGCAPKGYKTTVTARKNGQVLATTTSDENGDYRLTLAPGEYQIEPTGGQSLPSCSSETAMVKANLTTTLDLSCDTGLR